jgi:hypothetical protein
VGGGLNLSPTKILTLPLQILNPIKAFKTLGDMVGASKGADLLAKPLEMSQQLMGALRGSPTVFLKNAFGGGSPGGGASDRLMDVGATAISKAAGQAAQRGAELSGKLAGTAVEKISGGVGKAVAKIPLPVVPQVIGVAIIAAGKAINPIIQQVAKVVGKVAAKLIERLTKMVARMAIKMVKAAIQKGIQAARNHGPCKATNRRTQLFPAGTKAKGLQSALLNPVKFAKAVASKTRAIVRQATGGTLKTTGQARMTRLPGGKQLPPLQRLKSAVSSLRERIQGIREHPATRKAGKAVQASKGVAGFAWRAARSGVSAVQGASQTALKASDASQNLGKGQVGAAAQDLKAAGSAGKGAARSAVAPGRELAGKAWRSKGKAFKSLGKAVDSKRLGSLQVSKASQKAQEGLPRPKGGSAVRAISAVTQKAVQTAKAPFKALQQASRPSREVAKKVTRTLSAPVKVVRTGAGMATDLGRTVQNVAQAPLALSKGGQALGSKGDASAALASAQTASSHATAAMDSAQASLTRPQGLKGLFRQQPASPPAQQTTPTPKPPQQPPQPQAKPGPQADPSQTPQSPPPQAPHISKAGSVLWKRG